MPDNEGKEKSASEPEGRILEEMENRDFDYLIINGALNERVPE